MVVGLCVCVYLYVHYLDLQDCCKLSAGKRTIAIKQYFKKSIRLKFFIQGFVLGLYKIHDCNGCGLGFKPTIHEATFVAGDIVTLLFVCAAHEILHGTFYKSLGNRRAVYSQATCRM